MKLLFLFLAMLVQQRADGIQTFRKNNVLMGYSDRRVSASVSDLPPALQTWMEWSGTAEELTTSTDHVDPLLWTRWNQDAPYNNLCPEYEEGKVSATGCVATAMAQVMAYWAYPSSAFDWDNLLPDYLTMEGKQASEAQIQAVAELMHACGVALGMDYGASSSSNSYTVPLVLASQYGYNPGARMQYRRYMSYAEWAELMREELRAGRPIIYRGASSSSAHCFVVDGFNEAGFFHVNWGWGGLSDGWYRFTSLTPASQGTGGSSASDGYNLSQGMVTGLAPATMLSTPVVYSIYADSLCLAKNQQGADSASLRGYRNLAAADTIKGYLGLGLYQNDQLLRVLKKSTFSRPGDGGWNRKFDGFTIDGLTAGETYQLIAIWKDTTRGTGWQPVLSINNTLCGRTICATGSSTFTHSRVSPYGHPVCSYLHVDRLLTGHPANLTSAWTTDAGEYTGQVVFALDNADTIQFIAYSGMDIHAGATDTLRLGTLKVTVPAGEYNLWMGYYSGNTLTWLQDSLPVVVESCSTVTSLQYAAVPVLRDTLLTLDNPVLSVDAQVTLSSLTKNNAYYSGVVGIGIYRVDYDSVSTRLLTPGVKMRVSCAKGDTVSLHLEGNVADYLPAGRYCLMLRQRATGKSSYTVMASKAYRTYFTISSPYSAIEAVEQSSTSARKVLRNGKVVIVRNDREYDLLGRSL